MKAIEQCSHVVRFVMLYKVVLASESVDETLVTIKMNAIERCSHVVRFVMLYKVVLALESVDETLVCNHSNKSY